jgi:hypothetical protein
MPVTREQLEQYAIDHKYDDTEPRAVLEEMLLNAMMLENTSDQIDFEDAISMVKDMLEKGVKGVVQMTNDELIDGLLERATDLDCDTIERFADVCVNGWSDPVEA